jgi:uncharacterized protein (UPF0261 family)
VSAAGAPGADAGDSSGADAPARPVVAVLATLDTKGPETGWLCAQIEAAGGAALVLDMGVIGTPALERGAGAGGGARSGVSTREVVSREVITREDVATAGGTPLRELLRAPTRQAASPVMVAGATALLKARLAAGRVHAAVGLGGTQGTSNGARVLQSLPYGFPKLLVSTVASGDVSAFVDIKDITMMFSVGDLLGLNPLTRRILANAAYAAVGMARCPVTLDARAGASASARARGSKPVIGMTNLGTLTDGALLALKELETRGYEVLVFHAVGSGGRAMEQMMKEGLIGAVFDYALGELSDELFHGLRAANAERLTVAARLGLPQVICPGGAEHVGLVVPANTVPERWAGRSHVFHNPVILAPRLNAEEFASVARAAAGRLAGCRGRAAFLMPLRGTSRYAIAGAPLHDPSGDAAFLAELRRSLPKTVELVEVDAAAEDPVFVRAAVAKLVALIEGAPV